MSSAKCRACAQTIEHVSFVVCDDCWNEQVDLAIVRPVVDPREEARKLMAADSAQGDK